MTSIATRTGNTVNVSQCRTSRLYHHIQDVDVNRGNPSLLVLTDFFVSTEITATITITEIPNRRHFTCTIFAETKGWGLLKWLRVCCRRVHTLQSCYDRGRVISWRWHFHEKDPVIQPQHSAWKILLTRVCGPRCSLQVGVLVTVSCLVSS